MTGPFGAQQPLSMNPEEAAYGLCKEHVDNYHKREAQYRSEARQIARDSENDRSVAGLGRKVFEVPSGVAKEWIAKEGPDILKDKGWQSYMRRKNPDLFN